MRKFKIYTKGGGSFDLEFALFKLEDDAFILYGGGSGSHGKIGQLVSSEIAAIIPEKQGRLNEYAPTDPVRYAVYLKHFNSPIPIDGHGYDITPPTVTFYWLPVVDDGLAQRPITEIYIAASELLGIVSSVPQ